MANRGKGSHGWSSWTLKGGDEGIREEGIGTFGAALFDFVLERGFKKTPWASAVQGTTYPLIMLLSIAEFSLLINKSLIIVVVYIYIFTSFNLT